jgi:hypothetical protein
MTALRGVVRSGASRFLVGLVLAGFVAAMTAASWSASAPVLIRPLATFHGGVLGPQAVQPLRQLGFVLIVVAIVGTVVRQTLEKVIAVRERSPEPLPVWPPRTPSLVRGLLGSVVASVLVSLGLAGILNGPEELLILLAIVLASALVRSILLPRVPGYSAALGRIPVLLRVVAMGGAGYLVGQAVSSVANPGGSVQVSWDPVLVAVAIAIAVATLLFPGPAITSHRRTSS